MTDQLISNAEALGEIVRSSRRTRELSQVDLAELAGVGRKWVIALEGGNPGARLDHVLSVVEALGLDLLIRPTTKKPRPQRNLDEILGIEPS